MTHVVVLYADKPALLAKFGRVTASTSDSARLRLMGLDKSQFVRWLFENRQDLLLLDAWGQEKILDFSDMLREVDVEGKINALLDDASFTDVQRRVEVNAVVPFRRPQGSRGTASIRPQ